MILIKKTPLILRLIAFGIIFSFFCNAQMKLPDKYSVSGGVSFPSYPDVFYDYWKNGFLIQVSGIYSSQKSINGVISITYNRFSFDENRYFKKLKIQDEKPEIIGAATSILSLVGNLRYRVPEYKIYRPYIYSGIGILYSYISDVKIDYKFLPQTKEFSGNYLFCIPIGFIIEHTYNESIEIFIDIEHMYGLTRKNNVNTNYTAIKLGVYVF